MPGLFVSLDGIDGTGKSTQCRVLAEWLRSAGHTVTTCTDPGGTPVGDLLRALVLGRQHDMTLACEALLFMASRAELVAKVIRPALDRGEIVICDRFLLANVVYQGHAGGLRPEDLWEAGKLSTGGLEPDLTIVLDLSAQNAVARRKETADRVEARGMDYHERVRTGFLTEARRRLDRMVIVDAQGNIDTVKGLIRAAIEPRLPKAKP
ncbi:MAG: dTMP kinase [Gemmataceae bacterium]